MTTPGGVIPRIDIYDDEIPRIEGVLRELNRKVRTRQDAEGYRREIIERFEGIGLKVEAEALAPADDCSACGGSGKVPGTPIPCIPCMGSGAISVGQPEYLAFQITIVDRTERQPMDWEKYGDLIKADVLDLGEGGVIKDNRLEAEKALKEQKRHHHH